MPHYFISYVDVSNTSNKILHGLTLKIKLAYLSSDNRLKYHMEIIEVMNIYANQAGVLY